MGRRTKQATDETADAWGFGTPDAWAFPEFEPSEIGTNETWDFPQWEPTDGADALPWDFGTIETDANGRFL